MKEIGIVRRIDDLGRVVIPREFRRIMRIKDGDLLEAYMKNDGEVVFRKYSVLNDITNVAQQICDSVFTSCGAIVAVTDRDSFIAASTAIGKYDLFGECIGEQIETTINNREIWQYTDGIDPIFVTGMDHKYQVTTIAPIISDGELAGSVLFMSNNVQTNNEIELAISKSIALFLEKQLKI